LILRLLGQGGMGAVYLAQDHNAFNRRCVIKEMLPYYSNPAEKLKAEKDFEREARVLATLRFDGAPQVYEYFIESGKYYLVMEFVEGENLEDRATQLGGRLPADEAIDYGLQLANTLIYLGKQTPPVIHRDIKPANIILDQDQRKVKLVDFGLAKESATAGMTGTLSAPLGTPGYAPMEQYTNQVEPRTDVYALGATLHHLLTGRDPRNENGFDFPPLSQYLPGVRPELEQIIARMLAMKVADRPAAAEVRDVFESFVRPAARMAATANPFTFRSGPSVRDAAELAVTCDQYWEDGIYHLYQGHLEPWLDSINRHDLAVRAESIRVRGGNQAAGLEEFLRAANPTIPLPSLAVSARAVDLGQVEKGSTVTARLQIKNAGRGCLYGRIAPKVSWVTVRPQDFSLMPNQTADLLISVNAAAFDEGALDQPAFEINSNGGQEVVACQGTVTWQPVLAVEPRRRLHLGEVLQDQLQPVTAPLVLRNTGGGVLQGRLATDLPWLSFDTADFTIPSGGSATINVTANLTDPTLQLLNGVVRIETTSGMQELATTVGVRRDWYDSRTRTKDWLIYGALAGFGALALAVVLGFVALILQEPEYFGDFGGWYWVLLAMVALAAGGSAAIWYSRRRTARLDEMENYYHGRDLAGELHTSRFTVRKLIVLGAAGLLFGLLAGLRFAGLVEGDDIYRLIGTPLAGLLFGVLLKLVGSPSPVLPAGKPWLVKLWRGNQVDDSTTVLIVRTLGLMLTGAWLALAVDAWRRPLPSVVWGALLGLLLSTETHRYLALRLRWLLDYVRPALLTGLGVFWALGMLSMLRGLSSIYAVVAGYSSVYWGFPGLDSIFWQLVYLAVGIAGALAGLWINDNLGLGRAQAWRLFTGLAGLLWLVTLPVYLLASLLLRWFLPEAWADWLAFVLTGATIGAALWALYTQRNQVELASRRARQMMDQGVSQSRNLTRSAQGRLQQHIPAGGASSAPGWMQGAAQRVQPVAAKVRLPASVTRNLRSLSLPSLAEIEQQTPLTLGLAAALATLMLHELVSRLVVSIAFGLGMVFVFVLLLIALAVGIRYGIQYWRRRNP
jgi:serine/threonine protein kinase